jgi:energy-converting hydrogenase B subunit I
MMSVIVRTMTRLLTPAIIVFGLYVILHGHVTVGGGFQGGAVFASATALVLVAFGSKRLKKHLKVADLTVISCAGALLFAALGFGGIGRTFFYNFLVGSPFLGHIPEFGPAHEDIWTAGVIGPMNIGVALNVIASLSAIMLAMALASRGKGDGE